MLHVLYYGTGNDVIVMHDGVHCTAIASSEKGRNKSFDTKYRMTHQDGRRFHNIARDRKKQLKSVAQLIRFYDL